MPPKERRILKKKETPSLLRLSKKVVAKNHSLKEIKGNVPEDVYKAVKEKKMKRIYDQKTKERSGELSNKRRKGGDFREDYKVRRKNALEDPETRALIKKELS